MENKYCIVCKNKIQSGNLFCSYCGNVVSENIVLNKIRKSIDFGLRVLSAGGKLRWI